MQQNIYLMRHGQTIFNKRKKIQGICDSPLSPLGIKQSKIAANYFKDSKVVIDSAYSSTSETLEYVLGTDFPYKRIKGIKERDFGLLEGEPESLLPSPIPVKDFFYLFNGEKDDDFKVRIKNNTKEIMNNDKSTNILIVAHGVLMDEFYKMNEINSKIENITGEVLNCSIFHYAHDGSNFSL